MKKTILTMVLFVFMIPSVLTSCREENKTPEEKIEAALEEIDKEAKEAGETVSDDVEDALEDVQDEIDEVKEESAKD